MYVKYQQNRDKRFVKIVNTKNKLNCKNLQLAIQISKNRSFQTCITLPPIIKPNLRSNGLCSYTATAFQSIFLRTTDRRTDRQMARQTDRHRE